MPNRGQRGPRDYRSSKYNFWQARMHRFLRLFPKDGTAVGSWFLLSGFLGESMPSNHREARELIRSTVDTAVRHGFIRRLPQYGRSPNIGTDGKPHKECLWTVTDEGLSVLAFLDFLKLLHTPHVCKSSYKPKLLFGPGRTEDQLPREP